MWLYFLLGGVILIAAAVAALCIAFVDNKTIEYEKFSVGEGGSGIKIAHLSDLHFPRQAVDQGALFQALEEEKPDLVAFTGDLVVRSSDAETGGGYAFMQKLCARFPVYFSQGNHDYDNARSDEILEKLRGLGVRVLDNCAEVFEKDGKKLQLAGISEEATLPAFKEGIFTVLLSHRPERAVRLVKDGAASPALILCGHAHGGQFRIFKRGLFAPGQGLFPKYTSGEYRLLNGTRMIVSRGVGKSEFPFRFNNPPHVPIITVFL